MAWSDVRSKMAGWIAPKAGTSGMAASPYGILDSMMQRHAPRRGTWELMEAYKNSPWLRAATTKISEHIASTAWTLHRTTSKEGRGVRVPQLRAATKAEHRLAVAGRFKAAGGKMTEVFDHPVLDLLSNNPNPYMSGLSMRRLSQTYMDLVGEQFYLIEFRKNGVMGELWPVPAHWVQSVPTTSQPYYDMSFFGKHMQIPPEAMMWSKYLDPFNPYARGTGTGFSLGDEIETDEYAAKVMKTALYNNAIPATLIGVENITQDAAKKMKQEWQDRFGGPMKSNQIHIHPGKISVEQLQQKFADMQLLELRTFEREAFNSVYGIPPEIMGLMENSNKATAAAAETLFAREVLVPRLDFDRAEKQRQVVDRFDPSLILDYESPVPEDSEFRLEVFKGNPGAFNVGQWRKLAGIGDEAMPYDDVYLVPFNLLATKELYSDKPPPPAPVAAPKPPPLPPKPVDDADVVEADAPAKALLPASFSRDLDAGAKSADATSKTFDESQHPRDDHGRFGEGSAEAVAAAHDNHDQAVKESHQQLKEEIKEADKTHKESTKDANKELKDSVKDADAQLKSDTEDADEALLDDIKEADGNAAAENEARSLHAERIAEANKEHQRSVKDSAKQHSREISRIDREHKRAVRQANTDHEDRLEDAHHERQQALEDAKDADQKAAAALAKSLDTTSKAAKVHVAVDALKPERLTAEVVPIFRDRIKTWADDQLEEIGLKPTFNIRNPAVTAHLEEFGADRIGDIDDTTREALTATLSEGVAAGEDIDTLSGRVEAVFTSADGYRAENIARTEVNRSAGFATMEAYRQSGVVTQKQWLATQDDRTRESHTMLDGQVQDLEDDFEVEGQHADHPGDFGDPAQDCNCRCAVTAVIDEPKAGSVLAAAWKAHDRKLIPWEYQTKSAFQRGFAKQRADVLKALRG